MISDMWSQKNTLSSMYVCASALENKILENKMHVVGLCCSLGLEWPKEMELEMDGGEH